MHAYRGEPAPPGKPTEHVGRLQLEVLKSPAIWVLGLASAAMYVARYGIDNWGVLFLQEEKGYSLEQAGAMLAVSPIAQIVGMSLSGLISDRVFGAKRHPQALVAAAVQIAALWMLWEVPPGSRVLTIGVVAVLGFSLGNLIVFLGGLMAVDLCAPRAAGAAMGLVGLFSYIGAAVQDSVSGILLERGKHVVDGVSSYSFGAVFGFWIGASMLSLLFTATTYATRITSKKAQQAP